MGSPLLGRPIFLAMNTKLTLRCIPSVRVLVIVFAFLGFAHGPVLAGLADDLGDLQGYTIVAEETIADFEGCEHGKIIQFESGRSVTCSEYGYQYAYYADAVILVRAMTYRKQRVFSCKMVVEDEIYDVACEQYMKKHIAGLRFLHERANGDIRAYVEEQLKLFEGIGLR